MNNTSTSWKTSLIGLLTGGGISIDAIITQGLTQGWKQAVAGLGIALLGLYSKDHNITGGTKINPADQTGTNIKSVS